MSLTPQFTDLLGFDTIQVPGVVSSGGVRGVGGPLGGLRSVGVPGGTLSAGMNGVVGPEQSLLYAGGMDPNAASAFLSGSLGRPSPTAGFYAPNPPPQARSSRPVKRRPQKTTAGRGSATAVRGR
jgi:hypothetical protein